MTAWRVFHLVAAIFFGLMAVAAGGLAIWVDLRDEHYETSLGLTLLGLVYGVVAFKAWKLAHRTLPL